MAKKTRKSMRSHDGVVVTYRADRGKWVARAWMPDGTGSGAYRSKFFKTALAAEGWAEDERAKLRTQLETTGSGEVAELVPLYVEQVKLRGAGQAHLDQVQRVMDMMVSAKATNLRDATFETKILRAVTGHHAKRSGQLTSRPASDSYKRKMLVMARGFTKWATDRGYVGRNPLAGTRLGRATRMAKVAWTMDEVRILVSDDARWNLARDWRMTQDAITRCRGDKQAAAKVLGVHIATIYNRLNAGEPQEDPLWLPTVLGLYTGARPSEVRAMTWGMIDWEQGTLILPATAPGNKIRTERHIRLMDELVAILKPRAGIGSATIVSSEVARMKEGVYSSAFQRYCGRIGVTELGPHTLRHCCGSLMTAMGLQPIMVLLHLGHDDPKVSKRYAESAPKFAREVKSWGDQIRVRRIGDNTPPIDRRRQPPVTQSLTSSG